jgi:hypothetical protein
MAGSDRGDGQREPGTRDAGRLRLAWLPLDALGNAGVQVRNAHELQRAFVERG